MTAANRAGKCFMVLLLGVSALACASPPPPERDAGQATREAHARRNLGVDHLLKGRTAVAIRELNHAAVLDPADASTQLWLGEAHRRQRRLKNAQDHAERAVRLDPGLHSARLNLSGLYLQLGLYPEAAEQVQVLLDDPTYETPWQALNNRGWAEFQLGHDEQARRSFQEALEFAQNYWPARLNLGILEESVGQGRAAIVEFQKVIANSPQSAIAEANFRVAELYVSMGERQHAISHFEASVDSAPRGKWSERSRELLELLR